MPAVSIGITAPVGGSSSRRPRRERVGPMCRVNVDFAVVALVCAAVVLPMAPVSAQPFGINGHTPNDAVAERIVEAGISWVRIDLRWSLVEPERDVYDWQFYDALIDRLDQIKTYLLIQTVKILF